MKATSKNSSSNKQAKEDNLIYILLFLLVGILLFLGGWYIYDRFIKPKPSNQELIYKYVHNLGIDPDRERIDIIKKGIRDLLENEKANRVQAKIIRKKIESDRGKFGDCLPALVTVEKELKELKAEVKQEVSRELNEEID